MTPEGVDLSGRVAIVTGAAQGLGREYALELAGAGAAVVVNDVDADRAEQLVVAIRDLGGEAVSAIAPVGPTATAERLITAALDAFGRLDVLVTNAGILRDAVIWKMSDDDFDAVIATHLRGTFTSVRAAVIQFRAQGEGGRIIAIGSPTGQVGNFGQTSYAAAKAGIVGMVRTLAMETARDRITVNALIPTALTRMMANVPGLAEVYEGFIGGQPVPNHLRRLGLGSPHDAAALVAFLASDRAANITGQCIGIGGDRLSVWSHPSEVDVAFHDGGWSIAEVVGRGAELIAHNHQPVGPQEVAS